MAAQPGRYEAAQRELAYRVWRAAAQNQTETLRVLDRDHDWPLAKQTLADWRDSQGWVQRAAADDAEDARRTRAASLDRAASLASLDLQIERYERVFAAQAAADEVPDPRSMGAFANLMRLRLMTQRELEGGAGLDRLGLAMEVLRAVSELVRTEFPQHAPAWLELLEPAGRRVAETYG